MKIYYMRDNHTSLPLPLDIGAAESLLRQELNDGYAYGMLFSKKMETTVHAYGRDDAKDFLAAARIWVQRAIDLSAPPPAGQTEQEMQAMTDSQPMNTDLHDMDPAAHATEQQKHAAFEWLRSVSLGDPLEDGPALHAAILAAEIIRLNDETKRALMALRELVELKNLKEQLEDCGFPGTEAMTDARDDYERRKTKAWAEARESVSA